MAFVSLAVSVCLVACDGVAPGGGDAGDAGPSADAGADVCEGMNETPPEANPSDRVVRFHIQGPATAFLMDSDFYGGCTQFEVDDLLLELSGSCICECAPMAPRAAGVVLGAGGRTITWNSERIETYQRCHDCADRGWGPGAGASFETLGVPRAVAAGRHTIRFAVADSVPESCTEADGQLSCDGSGIPMAGVCEVFGARVIEVDFDLPASGDVDIDITIPAL